MQDCKDGNCGGTPSCGCEDWSLSNPGLLFGCDCNCSGNGKAEKRVPYQIAPTCDTYENWLLLNPLIPKGVLALVKDRLFPGSLEYVLGDGLKEFKDLQLYAGAPLSREGAVNASPLAEEGKSTLDPSWLPEATTDELGGVLTSKTGDEGHVPLAGEGGTLDSSWLPAATGDKLGGVLTSETGEAGHVPLAGRDGNLDPSWLPKATDSALGGVLTSETGKAGHVPLVGSTGKLDPSWFPDATPNSLGGVKASTTAQADCVVKADESGSLKGWHDAIATEVSTITAGAAKKLEPGHKIDGTLFDGTQDIVTEFWGKQRTVTIKDANGTNSGVAATVNGSANVELKLPAIIKATEFIGKLTGQADVKKYLATKNGGIVFSNGLVIQWGMMFFKQGVGLMYIALPIPLTNTPWVVATADVSGSADSTPWNDHFIWKNALSSNMRIAVTRTESSDSTGCWIAIGK